MRPSTCFESAPPHPRTHAGQRFRGRLRRWAAIALLGCTVAAGASGGVPDPDLFPRPDPQDTRPVDWFEAITTRIPPLRHERGDRWPLVLFDNIDFRDMSVDQVRTLASRGIVPHIPLRPEAVNAALTLREAGVPVIVMEGRSGRWPYPLAGDPPQWAHQYPPDADVPEHWRRLPSPTLFKGWNKAAEGIRQTLWHFRQAGAPVDAVWLDYEGEPSGADFEAARQSPRTAALLPREALESVEAFQRFRRQLWIQLLSTYMAAPVREIYPAASVTNWVTTLSSPEHPVYDWNNQPHPLLGPTLFTATNPIAYGVDTFYFTAWEPGYTLDRRQVDRFYTHLLLRQVSADAHNRERLAPYLDAVVWIARWVPDHRGRRAPVMSRPAYREALRHLWLRGVDAMQVFNPVRPQYRELAIQEVEDAVSVFDEMLAWRPFLEAGEPMNYRYPSPDGEGVLWSGLRAGDAAVVRVTASGPQARLRLAPWHGSGVELEATPEGRTYLLEKDPGTGHVRSTPAADAAIPPGARGDAG